jgi:thymidine kinase
MFSGKTEELVRRLRRARFAKQKVLAFKPVVDNRHSSEHLVSHAGVEYEAHTVATALEIYDAAKDAEVIGIDEAQFFDDQLPEIADRLAQAGKRVIVAGLDMDFRGRPFGVVPELMARADSVTKAHAVCITCGAPATRSQRIVDSSEQVLIGDGAVYQARCRAHWNPEPVFRRQDNLDDVDG